MTNFLVFISGLALGAGGYHFYLLQGKNKDVQAEDELALRLTALEEQVSYLANKVEDMSETRAKPAKASRKTQASTSKQEKVIGLIFEGLDYQTIARETGVPVGQVELIARLHGRE